MDVSYKRGVDPRAVKYLMIDCIRNNPGITTPQLALRFAKFFRKSALYGAHRNVSTIIAELRSAGIVEDTERCEHCGRSLTRGRRNVPLYLTARGKVASK